MHALQSDRPIEDHTQDVLGRTHFAKELAKAIVDSAKGASFVIGIYGQWGSGKTSVLNMIEEFLSGSRKKPIVLRFNPWIISEQNQLIAGFLNEMALAIGIKNRGKRARQAAKHLLGYAKFFAPLTYIPGVEPWASLIKNVVSSVGESAQEWGKLKDLDFQDVRSKLERQLEALKKPVVVFMDDIDRLSASEVRQVFQLVKTVANFPNTIYCLAFDPERVIKALDQDGSGDGQRYLEKIVQAGFELPQASESDVHRMLFQGLNSFLLEDITPQPIFDPAHWKRLFFGGINRLITSPRDIARLLNRLRITEPMVRGEVDFGDLVAVEVLALKSTPVYQAIRTDPTWFVGPRPTDFIYDVAKFEGEAREGRQRVVGLLSSQFQRVTTELLTVVFPKTKGFESYGVDSESAWRKNGLMTSLDRLEFYLKLGVPPGKVDFKTIHRILTEPHSRESILNVALSEGRLEGLFDRLPDFLDSTTIDDPDHLVSLLASIAESDRSILPDSTGLASVSWPAKISWAAEEILKRQPVAVRDRIVLHLCRNTRALSLPANFLVDLLRDATEGEPVVSQSVAQEALSLWLDSVKAAAGNGTLRRMRVFNLVLWLWREKGTSADVEDYLRALITEPAGLDEFMSGFASEIHTSDGVSYECKPETIGRYLPVDIVYQRCRERMGQHSFRDASERTKQAIESFVELQSATGG